MNLVIFGLNIIIIFSLVLDLRTKEADRRLSFGFVRILFILPLLAGSYLFAFYFFEHYSASFFYNSENIFAIVWMAVAYRLYQATSDRENDAIPFWWMLAAGSAAALIAAGYGYYRGSMADLVDSGLVFPYYGVIYCSSLFLLTAVLLMGWRLEAFFRSLDPGEKWRYKYLVVSLFLICAMLGWSSSYRLAYLSLSRDHFLLLAVILIIAWMGMIYAIARHRLLNRKLFVSRKVVYASITPIAFAFFFILVGGMALLTRLFGWSVPFVLQWLAVILGLLTIIVFSLSGSVRKRVKYFVSTHFYVNKYEYRDEWLAFSDLLQGRLSEKGVVEALYQILRDSLYTSTILIWLGDIRKGFRLMPAPDDQSLKNGAMIAGDDPIVCYLHNAPYLYSRGGDADPLRSSILIERAAFLKAYGIVLMVPLILGSQCAGLIGLGPEITGGRYSHDDFDLMAALCSHAASALLAVHNAEELARTREQSAWNNLSAFVLHDIKNAATMLDLVRKNAPQHMDNPEFQKDMLESIDDALKRMAKVQTRLSAFKCEMVPDIKPVGVGELLGACVDKLAKKLPDLNIELKCPPDLSLHTDPDFFGQIMENLLLNAYEAGGSATAVRIEVTADAMLRINVQDNGPGIPADLLPQALFEPFRTAKPNGSGIGLWQVRQLVERLGGDIQAKNAVEGGACLIVRFPYRTEPMQQQNHRVDAPQIWSIE